MRRVVTDRRRDVLAVPNAALRFRPEGMGQGDSQRTGQRQRQAGGQGQGAGESQAPGQPAGGAQRERGQGGGQGNGNWQRDRDAASDDTPPPVVKRTIWVEVDGKPASREVTTGITDGRVTEITGGTLKEGENVIVSVLGQGPGQQGQGQQRGGQGQGQRGGFRIL